MKWGELCLVSLYISVLSGLVVALQYDFSTPLYSTSAMDALVPFGSFWRSLHFYSSQLFFILSLLHFVMVLIDRRADSMSFAKWWPLVVSLPVGLLLLFTGYVLRGDGTGEMAGMIAENICLAIPGVGHYLNSLLFWVSESLGRVYANHVIGLGVIWGILSWDHIRKYRANLAQHTLFIAFSLLLAFIFLAPMEPTKLGVFYLPGPWFFLGLQEMLRYINPFWAGIIWPLCLVVALVLLHKNIGRRALVLLFIGCWLISYLVFSVLAFLGH